MATHQHQPKKLKFDEYIPVVEKKAPPHICAVCGDDVFSHIDGTCLKCFVSLAELGIASYV